MTTGIGPAIGGPATRAAEASVHAQLVGVHRLAVAFSGGVDSAVLLSLAARVKTTADVIAVLAVSPSLAVAERAAARRVAETIGVVLVEVTTREGEREEYVANGPDRCFYCKDELFAVIEREVMARHDIDAVAYGENADDAVRPDRPGAQAATAHRVLRPLATAGLTKVQVRLVATELGLPCADKPASPCLASRIPHYHEVTPAKLAQIDAAETALRELGLGDLRVRHHDDIARLELTAADLPRAVTEPLRSAIRTAVRGAGFRYVTIDLAGIQSGGFTLPLVTVGAGRHD